MLCLGGKMDSITNSSVKNLFVLYLPFVVIIFLVDLLQAGKGTNLFIREMAEQTQ